VRGVTELPKIFFETGINKHYFLHTMLLQITHIYPECTSIVAATYNHSPVICILVLKLCHK
jgi:hypothetical protein